jgi:DNA topoisomerase I
MAEKKERILLIVESPTKAKHVKEFLPANYIVMASQGHITRLADTGDYNIGIDFKNNFKPTYEITEEKKDIVKKLKEQVKAADLVILASDPDREGEAISYHLKTELKIPENKYKRITYQEVTKAAVLKALENPRKIDLDLVAAAISRECADKCIGYRLSRIARDHVGARSVGRCQSAGLKLITDREKEIQAFDSKIYYDLYLHFNKNSSEFKAKYIGTDKEEVKSFDSLDAIKPIAAECKKGTYSILSIEHKDSKESPKPPFITTTFQQEVARRLGLSVKTAMDCAQKLFENGYITYHRTDLPMFDPAFNPILTEFVSNMFGKSMVAAVKVGKKDDKAQAGHEALRVTDLQNTPTKMQPILNNDLLWKVYTIVWQRTVAAAMKPAIIANTIYTIENGKHRFSMTSKELKEEGYRKVYSYGADDDKSEDDQLVKETFTKGETLQNTSLEAIEKQTTPPARFTEASFVAELTKKGIGRPSTYATILSTILDEKRGYCKLDNKKLVPTDLAMRLSDFLEKSFGDVINIKYTAELESQLDSIAKGEKNQIEFMEDFYGKLEESIKKVDPAAGQTKICPECGSPMKIRKGKYGSFWGCSAYPKCKHMEPINKKKA